MRRAALLAVLAGVVVVLIGALAWWRPFLIEKRGFVASVPQPAPLFSLPQIPLKAGSKICSEPAVIDTHSQRAVFVVGTPKRPGEPLRLTMTGPGYRFATNVAGGYPDPTTVNVPVPTPRRDLALRVCIENAGRHGVTLWGADDRTRTPMTVTEGKTALNANVLFAFYESKPGSLAGHLPIAMKRMAQFRPGIIGPWLLWPLAVLCIVGVPVGALWSLWRSVRDEPDDEPDGAPPADVAAPTTSEPTWDRASAT
jgi:hypothetical protein